MSDTERESSDSDRVFHRQPEEADLRWQPMHWEVPRAPRSKHRALGKQGGAHRDARVDRALGMAGIWPSRQGMGTLDDKSDLSVGPGWDGECSCPAGAYLLCQENLVVQWLRICFATWGTQVQSLAGN